jgi:hypothetical protein
MMEDPLGKTESVKNDPGDLARVLELELIQKRVAWQRASTRYRALKTISILFLFIIIAGSLAAFFLISSRVDERHANQDDPTHTVAPKR